MATITDLPASIQDRICMDAAMMIMAEDEYKAYVLRCITLRRQPFIEGWSDPADFYERPVTAGERKAYQAHYATGEIHPFHFTEARHNAKYEQLKELEARIEALQ